MTPRNGADRGPDETGPAGEEPVADGADREAVRGTDADAQPDPESDADAYADAATERGKGGANGNEGKKAPSRSAWIPALVATAVALCLALASAVLVLTRDDNSTPGDNSPEAGFSRDMAIHHQQAVEMSFIVRDRTDDEEVRTLAYDIANTQANQRGMMLGWLDLWDLTPTSGRDPMAWMGGEHAHYRAHDGSLMPGMATNTQLDELRKAKGRQAEVLFLKLMIAHHRGGVEMARGAVDLAENEEVDRLAQGMVDSQQAEISLMNGMLKKRGAEPVR